MAKTRLTIRLDEGIKSKAQQAAALLGIESLTGYIVRLIEEDANRVLARFESITLDDDCFDHFIQTCEAPCEPNESLKEALAFANAQGFQ